MLYFVKSEGKLAPQVKYLKKKNSKAVNVDYTDNKTLYAFKTRSILYPTLSQLVSAGLGWCLTHQAGTDSASSAFSKKTVMSRFLEPSRRPAAPRPEGSETFRGRGLEDGGAAVNQGRLAPSRLPPPLLLFLSCSLSASGGTF